MDWSGGPEDGVLCQLVPELSWSCRSDVFTFPVSLSAISCTRIDTHRISRVKIHHNAGLRTWCTGVFFDSHGSNQKMTLRVCCNACVRINI